MDMTRIFECLRTKKTISEEERVPRQIFSKKFGHYVMCADTHSDEKSGSFIVSGVSLDRQVIELRIDDVKSMKVDETRTKYHSKGVNCVKYLQNGSFVATGSDDHCIIIMKREYEDDSEESEGEVASRKTKIEIHQKIEGVHHGNLACLEERRGYLISGGEDCLVVVHEPFESKEKDGRRMFRVMKTYDMKKILETEETKKARVWSVLSFEKYVVVGTDVGLVVFEIEE